MRVEPPWTASLTEGQHDLLLYGLVITLLALIATLARTRFAPSEVLGRYRRASLTAGAVVAIAALSYLALTVAFLLGYQEQGDVWVPTAAAKLVWSVRYMDWCVTVPLLITELLAISALAKPRVNWYRAAGISLAVAMVSSGYLGAVVIDQGRDYAVVAAMGAVGAICFFGLYALVLSTLRRSLPAMPTESRPALQSAIGLLLIVWLAYPIVYGVQGATSGGSWAVTGQLVLCAADITAKIGFGILVHRTAVLRSRADEQASPETTRPRAPQAEAEWVAPDTRLSFDTRPDDSHL